jgi:hypothetical protein
MQIPEDRMAAKVRKYTGNLVCNVAYLATTSLAVGRTEDLEVRLFLIIFS